MQRTYLCIAGAIVLLASASSAFAESAWNGTWKLDAARSKLTGDTVRFANGPDGELSYTADGHTTKFKMDGSPVTTWTGAVVMWTQVDDHTWKRKLTQNDVDLGTETWTLSPDGKTLKAETVGTAPDGSSFDDVSEFARVAGGHGLDGSWRNRKTSINEEQTYEISEKGPNELQWNIPAIKGVADLTLDGKESAPVGPTVPKGLTLSLTRVDAHTLKLVEKINGEPLSHSTITLSADGRTMTEVGSAAKTNEPYTEVWVKQ